MPDGGRCYIETENESHIGHLRLRLIELSPTRLSFDIVRKINNHVDVSFALDPSEFEEVRHIAEIIFILGEPEPEDGDAR